MLKNTSDDCQPYAIFSDVINYSVTHLLSYVELFFFFQFKFGTSIILHALYYSRVLHLFSQTLGNI